MSGTPTEAEIQTQWKNAVDILEDLRAFIDGTLAGGGGLFDVLIQTLEGEYTPAEFTNLVNSWRATLSSTIDSGTALRIMEPILFEYGKILAASAGDGFGSGARNSAELFSALYEWLHDGGDTIAYRNITYTAMAADGSNVGNAVVSRLTVDRNGYPLEACHVEKKMIRCLADANTGVNQWAESFEIQGEAANFDAVLRGNFGSGDGARTILRARHAGSGAGGSLLQNSSFSDFATAATAQKFDGWTETFGGAAVLADVTQDTTNYYRSHPNASTNASLKLSMDSAADTITLKQTIADMRISRLDPNTPYFLRLMWNRSIGTGTVGDLTVKLGGNTAVSVTLAAQSGWQELVIPFDSTCWLKGFNEDPFDIEIAWAGGTSGFLLIDDVIFAPWDLVDGTYWNIRQNNASPVAPLVDDFYVAADTGGAPGTGKLQYWCFVSGLGYLPAGGAPTISDP